MQVQEIYQILQIWQLFLKISKPSEEAMFESSQIEICVADFSQRLEIYLVAFAIKFWFMDCIPEMETILEMTPKRYS